MKHHHPFQTQTIDPADNSCDSIEVGYGKATGRTPLVSIQTLYETRGGDYRREGIVTTAPFFQQLISTVERMHDESIDQQDVHKDDDSIYPDYTIRINRQDNTLKFLKLDDEYNNQPVATEVLLLEHTEFDRVADTHHELQETAKTTVDEE